MFHSPSNTLVFYCPPPATYSLIDLKRTNHYHTIVNNFEIRGVLNVTKKSYLIAPH